MALESGYIKLFRKLTKWEWYDDLNTTRLFIHLLLTVNYEPGKWHGKEVKRGQRITSLSILSSEIGLSIQKIRTSISKLKSTHEITTESTGKYTVITVENYSSFQGIENDSNTEHNTQANNVVTKSQQSDNNKGRKQERKKARIEEEKNIYGEFDNVALTDQEYKKLQEKFPFDFSERIEKISAYIASTGKAYKSHYATMINWASKDTKQSGKADTNPFLNPDI